MGQIFRARDTQLGRSVATKVLYSDAACDEKEKEENCQPIVPVATASVSAFLGHHDDAFRWLEIGYAGHFPEMVFMRVEPLLFELRSHPRFADLVRRIGL